ncbi:MAG: hypothetical protein GX591_09125 [Planctomycetes bacterium]|nr:hypothetical protein [Planctomycetota bacterium]
MKRTLLAMTLTVLTAAAGAPAALTLIDDFESYEAGSSIHGQGLIADEGMPMWYTQANAATIAEHPGSVVVVEDGDKALRMTNLNRTGTFSTVYTALYFGYDRMLAGSETTVYLRWKPTVANDLILGTNDLWGGYNTLGGDANDPQYQGTTNYASQGARVRLSGDGQYFRAASGSYASGSYTWHEPQDLTIQAGQWYELWLWIDNPNDTMQIWVAPDGGTPIQMTHSGGQAWWDHYNRNHDNNGVLNLKFFHGGADFDRTAWIDTIAIDPDGFTLDRIEDIGTACNPGDADGDGDVDLDDFVILKNNFGTATGATCAQGDFDDDGDVDLDDFVLLKNNFGVQY